MKKIMILVLTIMFVILPIKVKADMGSPLSLSYEAVVTNPNGTNVYENDNNSMIKKFAIDYNTKITVSSDQPIEGYTYIFDDKIEGYVKTEDFEPINKKYIPTKEEELDIKKTAYILTDNSVYLYEGPSVGFSKIGTTIPKNTKIIITAFYADQWFYTEYNGKKGWVNYIDAKIGVIDETIKKDFYAISDLKLLSNPEDQEPFMIIPYLSNIEVKYVIDPWNLNNYYVSYNGKEGYASPFEIGYKDSIDIKCNSKINVYDYPNGKIINTILENSEVVITYSSLRDYWHYVEYNNIKGWIDMTDCQNNTQSSQQSHSAETRVSDEVVIELPKNTKIVSPKEIIIYSIVGTIIVGVTAFVVIKLINKNKTKKLKQGECISYGSEGNPDEEILEILEKERKKIQEESKQEQKYQNQVNKK